MIRGINTGSGYVEVTGGNTFPHISKNHSSSAHMQGQIRYDFDSQDFKIYDGSQWVAIGGSFASVDLSYDAKSLLEWTRQKRTEEQLRAKLIAEHPNLKEAHDALKSEEEKFELLVLLCQQYNQNLPDGLL
jgi:hypothetical protein